MTLTADPTTEPHDRGGPAAARGTSMRPRERGQGPPTSRAGARFSVGMQEQRAVLSALVDGARAGRGGAVLVRGTRGSGKTHLLDDAVADAADLRVLRATGVEVESGLPFGTVQQLCGPSADRVAELPPAQAEALGVALGLVPGSTTDPAIVGLGLVSLLARAASDRPVVCVVDDAEWVDESSAEAIGVAARRLVDVGVVLLIASGGSEAIPAFTGVDEVRLHPLSQAEAQRMLGRVLPGRLDPDVQDRVLAEARGNPRVLGQLGRATTVTALAGGFAIDAGAQVDDALDACVARRLSGLPEDVAAGLLLAAAEPLGDVTSFRRALASTGLSADVEHAVEATGLAEVGDRLLFGHPLVRHLVYRDASDRERRHAHRVLAGSVGGTGRADHVAWHRAQATTGAAEPVAQALERWSGSAGRAGGDAAAAAFLGRSTALSEEPGARARRGLDAARLHARSGGFDEALRQVADVDHRDPGDTRPAMAHLAAAEIAWATGRRDATRDLLGAAERCAGVDPEVAASTFLSAFDAAASAGRFDTNGGVGHAAARARQLTTAPGASRHLLGAAAARWGGGGVADHEGLARALDVFCADPSAVHPMATRVAMGLLDEEAWSVLARREVDHARRTGASAGLPRALDLLACLHLVRGEVALAVGVADEAAAVARRIGAVEPSLAPALLAGRGRPGDDPLESLDTWARRASRRGEGGALTLLEHTRSQAHLASGRYEEALREAQHVLGLDEPFVSAWAAPEVVEAAVRSGRPEDAAQAFDHVRSVSAASGSSWARGIEHRCSALLAEDGSTEEHFRESARYLERAGMRVDLARTHLLHGEWLRRQARRVDARTPLRQALEVFDATGATAFVARASLELRASGEQARRRTPDTVVDLTERESQVAGLAIEGYSNPDIGMQLFISARTVEYHLHKVFSKLGITSRAQLRAAWRR